MCDTTSICPTAEWRMLALARERLVGDNADHKTVARLPGV
jgi:hypothetical protein